METLNRMATELVDEAIDFAEELGIGVRPLEGDAAVIDFGVDVPGGIEAGLLLTEIQTAGLATVGTTVETVADAPLTHVELSTDHPALALLAAGKGGWEVSVDDYEALGSGPARALVATEDIYRQLGYREEADFAVLALESGALPDERVAAAIAERTGVTESSVFLPTYRSASLTGSVVGAARAGELATHRLVELGYDPADVLSVSSSAPVAPVAGDEASAMARTTDAVSFGGRVHLVVDSEFDQFGELPSTAASTHGEPFGAIYDGVGWEFAELDLSLFGPAQVTIDVVGGDTHVLGGCEPELLADSFGLA